MVRTSGGIAWHIVCPVILEHPAPYSSYYRFHDYATVRAYAPKSIRSRKVILDIVRNLSIGIFSDGFASIMEIFNSMGMNSFSNTYNMCGDTETHKKRAKILIGRCKTDESRLKIAKDGKTGRV